MDNNRIRKVVIAGGGTAGWVAACALTHQFRDLLEITLVESEEIGTVGVGESTIPTIRTFHRLLQIDEREFMKAVAGSFKLAISFENWKRPGERYFHPFGTTGVNTWSCDFHQFWLESRRRGIHSDLGDYCLETAAARLDRFALFDANDSALQWSMRWTKAATRLERSDVSYAYHFDAALYAAFMRAKCEGRGLKRVEGKIAQVRQDPGSGYVQALVLEDGQVLEGDLFIDCTGFRGLLIEQTLKTGYEDWNNWLPCNRAVAMQVESDVPPVPYTRAIAHEAGWRWHIALQHRVGCGWVFSSEHMSDDEAAARLRAAYPDDRLVREPWVVPFRTGRRRQAWNKNVVSLGLASSFIEPLESTSIHLTLSAVTRLVQLFPFEGISQAVVDRYNKVSRDELEHIRNFIILHYHLNQRDEPMWKQCREMQLPPELAERIQVFRDTAYAWQGEDELFRLDSWTHCMLGQGVVPKDHHPLTRGLSDADMQTLLQGVRRPIERAVQAMPQHHEFLKRYCPADPSVWHSRRRSTVG